MEHFLKAIFSGKNSEDTHSEFMKYGRGSYENKYLLNGKKQKDKWNIKTSAEFANYLVKKCLEKSPERVKIKGVIVSTFPIEKEMDFPVENIKKYMGIQQAIIDAEVSRDSILSLMNKYPRAFYALSFSTDNCDLKIKPKPPKGAKPSASREKEATAGFCKLKTNDKSIIDDLFFDSADFNEVSVNHTLVINEIVLPEGVSNPSQIRERSQRKGIIKRKIVVDGKEIKTEANFEA